MQPTALLERINATPTHPELIELYGNNPDRLTAEKQRYTALVQRFQSVFPQDTEIAIYSSPGRTEVGGNHTDHNAGRVLAAAVDLDILAVVSPSSDGKIVIDSEGYPQIVVNIAELDAREKEKYTSTALVRGVCARFQQLGLGMGGFHACLTSNVPNGSGLSSSAAFEVMIATILNHEYNQGKITPVQAAQIGQYAENNYFGKPSGLMDQTTSAVGGFVKIDFQDFKNPIVHKVDYRFSQSGYALAIIGTGGSHANLNEDYAAIANEMKAIAGVFGGQVLREFSAEKVLQNVAELRGKVNDRAILRALHFYADDQRVNYEVEALERNDFQAFLKLVLESGISSWTLLQNVFTPQFPLEQGVSLALALSETILKGRGAWRVHGGGFAGTIQAFVPLDLVPEYMRQMAAVFGPENCHLVSIRPVGGTRVAF